VARSLKQAAVKLKRPSQNMSKKWRDQNHERNYGCNQKRDFCFCIKRAFVAALTRFVCGDILSDALLGRRRQFFTPLVGHGETLFFINGQPLSLHLGNCPPTHH
jgi:hypothetical protein